MHAHASFRVEHDLGVAHAGDEGRLRTMCSPMQILYAKTCESICERGARAALPPCDHLSLPTTSDRYTRRRSCCIASSDWLQRARNAVHCALAGDSELPYIRTDRASSSSSRLVTGKEGHAAGRDRTASSRSRSRSRACNEDHSPPDALRAHRLSRVERASPLFSAAVGTKRRERSRTEDRTISQTGTPLCDSSAFRTSRHCTVLHPQ